MLQQVGFTNWNLHHQVPSDLPQNATFSFKIDYTDSKGVS